MCKGVIDDEKDSNFQSYENSDGFQNIILKKFDIIYENLVKHDYVCFTDGDIVFENNNFFTYLVENIENNDMLIQNDTGSDENDDNLCSGFMFIKSNSNTISLFDPKTVQPEIIKHNWFDQEYINDIKQNLTYKKLPVSLFPNGMHYFMNSSNIQLV